MCLVRAHRLDDLRCREVTESKQCTVRLFLLSLRLDLETLLNLPAYDSTDFIEFMLLMIMRVLMMLMSIRSHEQSATSTAEQICNLSKKIVSCW